MSALKGVGEKRIKLYKKLGVDNIYSLLCFYPRKYINLSSQLLICDTILDSNNIVKAVVYKKQGEQRIRKDLSIFKVLYQITQVILRLLFLTLSLCLIR